MKDTLVYLNPTAGSGRSGAARARLRAAVPELQEARWVCGGDRRLALAELRRALGDDAGLKRVLAVGGDGTLNRVAQEILRLGLGSEIRLGLVPAGTGSDLARFLGLPRRPEAALARALSGHPRPVDALRLRSPAGVVRYAVNVASAGVSGVVDQAVNAKARRTALVYVLETLKAALRFRSMGCRLTVDGEPFFEGEAFLIALANSRYFGRGMMIAPEAEVDDGEADVVVVEPVPLWHLPWRILQLFRGSHLGAAPIRWRRGRRARLELPAGAPTLDLDGEELDATSVEIEVLPGALQLLV